MKLHCPECGAAAAPGASRCDLCGSPIEAAPAPPPDAPPPPPAAPTLGARYCVACGHANPAAARFCNACGAPMPAAPVTPPGPRPAATPSAAADRGPAARPSSAPGRRALALVGVGVAAVAALYGLTLLSRPAAPAPPAASPALAVEAGTPGGPLPVSADDLEPVEVDPASVATPPLPDSLAAAVAQATAGVQAAERENTPRAWAVAGGRYMDLLAGTPEGLRGVVTRQAIASFQRSLALADDPDVRASMAWAYRYEPDPRNTMQAVAQLQRVLEADSAHAGANFYLGALRMQIGRVDGPTGAAAQFRKVVTTAPHDDPFHRLAARELEALGLTGGPQPGGTTDAPQPVGPPASEPQPGGPQPGGPPASEPQPGGPQPGGPQPGGPPA